MKKTTNSRVFFKILTVLLLLSLSLSLVACGRPKPNMSQSELEANITREVRASVMKKYGGGKIQIDIKSASMNPDGDRFSGNGTVSWDSDNGRCEASFKTSGTIYVGGDEKSMCNFIEFDISEPYFVDKKK